MRIYAARPISSKYTEHSDNQFVQYIGQDIWVLCYNYAQSRDMFVRVIRVQDHVLTPVVTYNRVLLSDLVNGIYMWGYTEPLEAVAANYMKSEYQIHNRDLYVKYPTELLSSNEVQEYLIHGGCPL